MRRTTCVLLGIAALLVFGGASCGDDDDDASPTTASSETTEAPTTTVSPEDEVKAAYAAFAAMGARLLQAPDPDDPEIAQRTSGEAQGNLVDGLTTLQSLGQRYELGPQYKQDVLSVELREATATAKVCVIDDVRLLDPNGSVLGEGTTTAEWTVTLHRKGAAWLVDAIGEREIGEGALTCS